jgi:hypothetical protein
MDESAPTVARVVSAPETLQKAVPLAAGAVPDAPV